MRRTAPSRAIGYLLGVLAPTVVAEPPDFIFIRTFPQIAVAVGDRLAMVVSSPGTCGVLQGPLGDSYAGGSAFFDALPNTPGVWVAFSDFPSARDDLAFQTWVR